MTLETFLYLVGAAWVAVVGWGIKLQTSLNRIESKINDVLEHSEVQGIELINTRRKTNRNFRVLKSLVYYVKWFSKDIPPHIEE